MVFASFRGISFSLSAEAMMEFLLPLAQLPVAQLLLAQDDAAAPIIFGGGFLLVWLLLGIAALILWLWALIHAIQNPSLSGNERLIWILVIVLTSWIGALIYLAIGRQRRLTT
jgi:predicted metal-binding membrane protein